MSRTRAGTQKRKAAPESVTASGLLEGAFPGSGQSAAVDSRQTTEGAGLTETTREALLRTLKMRGEADVVTLSAALSVSSVGVRQHLASLQGASLVEARLARRPVGRPATLYRLTE